MSAVATRRPVQRFLQGGAPIYLFLVLLVVVAGVAAPAFLSADNVSNMLQQLAPLGIVVIGQTFVILLGGLDLSVASVMATAAVAAMSFSGRDRDVPAIIGAALAIGVLVGLANGLLVAKRRVSPFLATLAVMVVLQGLRFAWTHGAPSGNVPGLLRALGSQTWHGLPYALMLMLILGAGAAVLLHRATFGRRVYLVGGGPVMARLVGINTDRITIAAYVMSAVMAAIAGLVLSGYVGIVDNFVGRGFELDSIVAAVIGGVALSGGRGTIGGALAGAAVLVAIFNAVLLFGLPVQAQIIIKGIVIVAAAAFYVKRH